MAILRATLASFIVAGLCFFIYIRWSNRRPPEASPVTQGLEKLEVTGLPLEALRLADIPKASSDPIKGKLKASTQATAGKVRTVSLREFANDSAVIVNFWASWCEPCAREVPSMLRLAQHFKGQLKIVAISADESLEDARKFAETFKLSDRPEVIVLWDPEKSAQSAFGVQRLPESYLFRRGGKFQRKVIGVDQWYTPQSIEFVKIELLNETNSSNSSN